MYLSVRNVREYECMCVCGMTINSVYVCDEQHFDIYELHMI